jgi:hypothetical protein
LRFLPYHHIFVGESFLTPLAGKATYAKHAWKLYGSGYFSLISIHDHENKNGFWKIRGISRIGVALLQRTTN